MFAWRAALAMLESRQDPILTLAVRVIAPSPRLPPLFLPIAQSVLGRAPPP
jgi:hypothetical protein